MKMKKLSCVLVVFSLVVFCKNVFAYDKGDIVGSWRVVSFSEMEIPKEQKTYYVFKEDGSFEKVLIIDDYKEVQKGYWTIKNNTITIRFPEKDQVIVFTVILEKGYLVLSRLGMTTKFKRENLFLK